MIASLRARLSTGPPPPTELTTFTAKIGTTAVCYLAGELDHDTRPAVAAALQRAQAHHPRRLCVVTTRLTFMSCAGLALLQATHRHLTLHHTQLYLVAPSPACSTSPTPPTSSRSSTPSRCAPGPPTGQSAAGRPPGRCGQVQHGGRPAPEAPAVAVRVCALILQGRELCLIRRHKPGNAEQFSIPGGLVHPGETTTQALARELAEELGLDVAELPEPPRLRHVQDQLTTRPGRPGLLYRLHLVYVVRVPLTVRQALAVAELDADDVAEVVWVDVLRAAGLHLYPAVGPALAVLNQPAIADSTVLLEPMTDRTYTWH
ncbi:NUDIX domain-containing protein [Kitasatospora sp. NPDC001664]